MTEPGLGTFVVNRRWWIIVIAIILAVVMGNGTKFLTYNNDSRAFFSKNNPQLQALEELEDTYTKIENVLFVVAPKDRNVFTRETLAAVRELTAASWKAPYSSRVDSITNFQHTVVQGDDLLVRDLVAETRALGNEEIEKIKKVALSEPLLVNRLISPTGHVTGVNINFIKPGKSAEETREIADYVSETAQAIEQRYPGIDISITGGIMIDNALGKASEADMTNLIPVMLLVLLTIIGIALRSVVGTVTTFCIIMVSMVTALGLAGYFGIALTSVSANAPTIILTLAVVDSVHILASVYKQMRQGMTRHQAIAESMRINLQPVFLTSFTTALGFLSMNFADAPPFRDLGNIVAMGVIAAFLYSIFFLPALLAVLPLRVRGQAGPGTALFEHFGNFVVKHNKTLLWCMLAAVVAFTAGISRIELDDNFVKYFDASYDFRRATDFAEKNLTGFDIIEYSLSANEQGGINEPQYLEKVEAFANWYRRQPNVVHVNSLTDTIKRLNRNMHNNDEAYYRIPEQRDLVAQYLLLYEMSLPFGLDLNDQINVDKSATRLIVTMKDMTAKELREMDEQAREWLKNNAPDMYSYGSGLSVMFAHISERNIRNMLGSSFLALVLVSAILLFALRSLKLGLLSLLTNLAPAFMALGIWGIFAGQVGMTVSILATMTLGIVVDDTIHFMSKYLRAKRELNMHHENAVKYSFNTVGTAIMVSTVSLVSGFLVLSLSGFKINYDMGVLSAITITISLMLTFLLLPPLLIHIDR